MKLLESAPAEYQLLFEALEGMYEPVHLDEFAPDDRFKRRQWLDRLALSVPFIMYCYQHSNFKGTEHFLWRIPSDPSCRKRHK